MNALALVIGIDDYEAMPKLSNAVNDAVEVGNALENLGFIVRRGINSTIYEFNELVENFGNDLGRYDAGVFYFAGHGFQLKDQNLLAGKEVITTSEFMIKRDSVALKLVIDKMDESEVKTKIIILDACRKNIPDGYRGLSNATFGPVYAPKGTLIAFSTSPGEGALDGTEDHSHYTSAFLRHLKDPDLQIEEFFKRVRTTVATVTAGKQTSWEHTSLIGEFKFNSGQLRHSRDLPYSDAVIADHLFKSANTGSAEDQLLTALSADFHQQNAAIGKINQTDLTKWDDDHLFLLGRALIGGGENNAFNVVHVLKDLKNWLITHGGAKKHHILNGMLYEIYFDSKGLLRRTKNKITYFTEILRLESDVRFKSSFEMINEQLRPFQNRFPYLPSAQPKTLPIDMEVADMPGEANKKRITAINIHDNDITIDRSLDDYKEKTMSYEDMVTLLSNELLIPRNRITINPASLSQFILKVPFSFYHHRATKFLFEPDKED